MTKENQMCALHRASANYSITPTLLALAVMYAASSIFGAEIVSGPTQPPDAASEGIAPGTAEIISPLSATSNLTPLSAIKLLYLGTNYTVRELYTGCGSTYWCWGNVSGTSANTAQPAAPGSPLASVIDKSGRFRIYYLGAGGLLFELYNFCGSTGWCWGNVSGTSINAALPALAGSPLTAIVDNSGSNHIYYLGAGGLLYELYDQCGSTGWCWGNVSGTSMNAALPAASGSPLTSLIDATGRSHIYYLGSGGLLYELYDQCGSTGWCWGNVSGTSINAALPAASGSPLTSLIDSTGRSHIYYLGSGGLLYELYDQCGSTGWCWGNVSGTSVNAPQPAAAGSPLASAVDTTGRSHIYYLGSGGLIYELYDQCGPTGWCWGNISGTSSNYAPPAKAGSTLAALVDTSGRNYVYYLSTGGLIYVLYDQCGPTGWCWGNVSGTSSNYAPPAIAGSPISIPVIYGSPGTLTVNVKGNGGGVTVQGQSACSTGSSCSYTLPLGTKVSVNAVPQNGYTFQSAGNCGTVTISALPQTCTVTFSQAGSLNVSVSGSGGGTVSVSGRGSCVSNCTYSLPVGTVLNVAVTPNKGYTSQVFGSCGTVTIVTSPQNCAVSFVYVGTGMLTVGVQFYGGGVSVSPGGSCGPGRDTQALYCSYTYTVGTPVTITPISYLGYFSEVFGNCGKVLIGSQPLTCGVEFFSSSIP